MPPRVLDTLRGPATDRSSVTMPDSNSYSGSLKAIETVYNGYRFRSRLEARWAVFFDHLDIEYVYEPEGFDLTETCVFLGYKLGQKVWYLPDFWLPQVKMWAEVKAKPFTSAEKQKCEALAKGSGYSCLMLDGPPSARNYWAYERGYGFEQEPELMDYVLYEPHLYWLAEGRFYASTGAVGWEVEDLADFFADSAGEDALIAARQARFEHGENP